MKRITNSEMLEVSGGSKWGIVAGICAGLTFIIGFFDGYIHPKACNS